MLVSIIIPVYNAEKYLNDCVNSILVQDFKDYEVILINDGSKDHSIEICNCFAAKYSNIKVVSIENGGPSNARNIGLSIANGEYIQFLDSDDELKNGMLSKVNKFAMEYDYPDIILFESEIMDEKRRILRNESLPHNGNIDFRDELINLNQKFKSTTLHYKWNKWYKKDIIDRQNIKFDKDVRLGEDFIFNCDYLKHCRSFVYVQQPLHNYFKRENQSLTAKFRPNEITRRRTMYHKLCELYNSFGVLDECAIKIEALEGYMALVSMQSIGFLSCNLSTKGKVSFLKEFMNSEYSNYIRKGINTRIITGPNKIRALLLCNKFYKLYLFTLK